MLFDFENALAAGGSIKLTDDEQAIDPATLIKALGKKKDAKLLRYLLMICTYKGDIENVRAVLKKGVPIDTTEETSGMTPLHIAVGRDDLNMTKFLVGNGAGFKADKSGRWPTTIAAVCEVSRELCDYIVEAEAKATPA